MDRDALRRLRSVGECAHGYWHATQCPYCHIVDLKRELFVLRLKLADLQRAHDVVASDAARLRTWRNQMMRTRPRARKPR